MNGMICDGSVFTAYCFEEVLEQAEAADLPAVNFYKATGATELSSVLEPSKKHGLPS
jgi:hypothetical protein